MGGEWGIASALTFETLPPEGRGVFSGLLQQGYVLGSLFAGIVVFIAFDTIGWRGMFLVGATPALLVWYVRRHVEESPAFVAGTHKPSGWAPARCCARWRSTGSASSTSCC